MMICRLIILGGTAFIFLINVSPLWADSAAICSMGAEISLQVPYGIKQTEYPDKAGLLVQDSHVSSFILIRIYHSEACVVMLSIVVPKPLIPQKSMDGVTICESGENYLLTKKVMLRPDSGDWYDLIDIYVPPLAAPGKYEICANGYFCSVENPENTLFRVEKKALVRIYSPREIENSIAVREVVIPADLEGNADKKNASNTLFLRTGLGILGKIFGSIEKSDMTPASFARIRILNRAEEDIILLVRWEVLSQNEKKTVRGFDVPREFLELHGGGDNRIQAQVFIPGKEEAECILPVFADEREVLSGTYVGRVRAGLFGSDITAFTHDFELTVRKMSWTGIGLSVYAVVITIGVFFVLLIRNRRIFEQFNTRWLILIALFGSLKFLVSLVPSFFLSDFFNGIFGPFAVFITGIFREGITYLFLMPLLVLIPLPGVVSLSMLMSLILFCLVGNFNPVFILFLMVSMSTMELALYASGFTRGKADRFSSSKSALIVISIAMASANAFSIFVDYNLYMVLYRLYYARWFIFMNVLIVGFFYAAIFTPAGILLGNKLKKVAAI